MARKNQLTYSTARQPPLSLWSSLQKKTRQFFLQKTPSDDTAFTQHHW